MIDVVLKRFSSGIGVWGGGPREGPEHPAGTGVATRGCGVGRGARALTFSFYSIHTEKYFPYSVNKGNIIFCFWWYFYDREMWSMVLLPCTYIVSCVLMKDWITNHILSVNSIGYDTLNILNLKYTSLQSINCFKLCLLVF